MKVVQINGVSNAGSTGKIVTQLSCIMDEQEIENYIISAGYKEEKKKANVFFTSTYLGVRVHQLLGTILGDTGFHSYFATKKVIRYLKKFRPDVVHLHNIYSYFLNVEILLKYLKKSNIKTLWTLHDFWPITGHCTHFETEGCFKWKERCNHCSQLKKFPYSRFFDRSTELFNRKKEIYSGWKFLHLATVSKWVADYIPYSILGKKEVRIIPNGIDTAVFKPKDIQVPDFLLDKFVILSVAMSWGANKGLDDFIELSKKLKKDEVIVLIGLNDEQINSLPTGIIGIKRTKNMEKLADFYNMASVYISTSTEETMGLTVVEAMACGTPAVVYNKTALPELIVDGCGYVCEKSVDAIYSAIQTIRANGKEKYSNACRLHATTNYDKNKQYKKYCEYYQNIVGDKNED